MAIKLADAIVFFKGDKSGLQQSEQEAEKETRSWVGKVGGMIATGFATAAVAAGAAIVGALAGAGKLAWDAMPLEGIESAFYSLADGAKLAELRIGTLNTVTDASLMESYNRAAMLVGKTFADELPSAMEYFGKISAATGDDIDYLMNSYVTGIGRLSPMILDNLGIQVNLNQAYTDYAEKMGISVEEMTKQEQQAALTAQVQTLLAENTAGMADISDNAAVKAAQLQAALGNMKDQIGLALLPVLKALLIPLAELAQKYGPKVTEFFERIGPVIASFIDWLVFGAETGDFFNDSMADLPQWLRPIATVLESVWTQVESLAGKFELFFGMLGEGVAPLDALWVLLRQLGLGDWADLIVGGLERIPVALEFLRGVFSEVWPVIQGVIAMFFDYVQTMIPIWQQWGQFIQQVVQDIVAFVSPLIAQMAAFFAEKIGFIVAWVTANLPLIQATFQTVLDTVKAIWEAVWPAIQLFLTGVWETIKTVIDVGLLFITGLIETVMKAIQGDWEGAWETIKETAAGIFDAIVEGFNSFVSSILEGLGSSTEEFVSIWSGNWEKLQEIVANIFGEVEEFIAGIDLSSLATGMIDGFINGVSGMAGAVIGAVRGVFEGAVDAGKAALGIRSPSKIFGWMADMSVAGFVDEMTAQTPQIAGTMRAAMGAGVQAAQDTVKNVNYYLQPQYLGRDEQPDLAAQVRGLQILTQGA